MAWQSRPPSGGSLRTWPRLGGFSSLLAMGALFLLEALAELSLQAERESCDWSIV